MTNYKMHLYELGIPVSLNGFDYLSYALDIYTSESAITKDIYPQVAKKFGTTPARVERAIRHAIGKLKLNPKVTNREFLARYKMLWEEEETIKC